MTQQECELMIEEEKLHLEKFGSEGRGIFTRLTYAVEQLKDHQHQLELKAQKWEIVSKFDAWMRMENDVAVVHKKQWNEFLRSFGSHSKKDEESEQPLYTVPKEIAEKAERLAAEIDAFKKGSK